MTFNEAERKLIRELIRQMGQERRAPPAPQPERPAGQPNGRVLN